MPTKRAETLDEAARNQDGTYNGAALSWLSDVLSGGKGIPEDEVRRIWEEVKRKRANEAHSAPKGLGHGPT